MRSAHALALLAAIASAAAARPAPTHARTRTHGGSGAGAPQGTVAIALTVGGKTYNASSNGQCRRAPLASIYGVRAAMWSVQAQGGAGAELKHVTLTVWHPLAGGADQMSLGVQVGSVEHRIDTVKGAGRGATVGSGTAVVRPQGMGGRFEIDGRDAKGTPIRGTISCPRFAALEAAGG